MSLRRRLSYGMRVLLPLVAAAVALVGLAAEAPAAIQVQVSGGASSVSQQLPDAGGSFDVAIPLRRNAVNRLRVTASDGQGHQAEQEIAVTQVSLESVVVSKIKTERLPPERVEQLVADGVIDLAAPENYNVSTFDVVLTIGQRPVPISVPVAVPKDAPTTTGYEKLKIPGGRGDGGAPPKPQPVQVVVFDQPVVTPSGQTVTVPGVLVIEGRIKTLKEFFSVRLLLMNTSGIFTLSDVSAEIHFPEGGVSATLPSDGVLAFGDIVPGDGGQPGQAEREFIIRGDEIGVHPVKVDFAGMLTGPGIPADEPVPFNGSAATDVQVKGPPKLKVQVSHPDAVVAGVPYDLEVKITNTDDIPALYTSLDLDVGFDGRLVDCGVDDTGAPVCTEVRGRQPATWATSCRGRRSPPTSPSSPRRAAPSPRAWGSPTRISASRSSWGPSAAPWASRRRRAPPPTAAPASASSRVPTPPASPWMPRWRPSSAPRWTRRRSPPGPAAPSTSSTRRTTSCRVSSASTP